MLSRESLERIRCMTNSERLQMTLQMIDESLPWMLHGPAEVVDRRFELLRRQNEDRTRRICEGLSRLKPTP